MFYSWGKICFWKIFYGKNHWLFHFIYDNLSKIEWIFDVLMFWCFQYFESYHPTEFAYFGSVIAVRLGNLEMKSAISDFFSKWLIIEALRANFFKAQFLLLSLLLTLCWNNWTKNKIAIPTTRYLLPDIIFWTICKHGKRNWNWNIQISGN